MRTRMLSTALPLLCSGVLLLGCADPLLHAPMPPHAELSADVHYVRGRTLHLLRRHDEAAAAYQAALRVDPGHVNAANGLAIVHAEQRDVARAIPIWHALTQGATMDTGPAGAFLFANLGHAYFLDGDYDKAVANLEKACLLDPLDARAWQRLGEALHKLGQEERARQMLDQARALREHDFQADYAAASGGARVPAIAHAVRAGQQADQEWAATDIIRHASGILELRRVTPSVPPPKQPAAPVQGGPQPVIAATLDISNGSGRQGQARLVSHQLARQIGGFGVKRLRLSNEKDFKVRQTRIEYQPAFRDLADRLAQRFGTGSPVAVGTAAGRADVRLVIGRDLPPQGLALGLQSLSGARASTASLP